MQDALSKIRSRVVPIVMPHRRVLAVATQISLIALSNYFAFWLRFDGQIPATYYAVWIQGLPFLLALRALTFLPFRLYQGLWRYSSIHDLQNIVGACVSSSLLLALFRTAAGPDAYPRSIYFVDSLLLVCMLGGVRLGRRLYREIRKTPGQTRVLIYGAGDAGELIVRDMKNNPFYDMEPVGFVDDDRTKVGLRIHGVPVLGTRRDLPDVLRTTKASEVLIAMPAAQPVALRAVVTVLEPFKIPIKTLPNLRDIFDGTVNVSQIRDLSLEDLLPRVPIGLDQASVRSLLCNKSVLITGAGGSIGSELSRQVANMSPSCLVLFERYENSLHDIVNELTAKHPLLPIHGTVGDITDVARVTEVMRLHQPFTVFHAAAHKHVPLMEENPCEAIKNNVRGTRTLAEIAEYFGVAKFILISTDKAVNPVSVMGASKRIAELIVQSRTSVTTDFMAVRFGNVLGSNGSVVPHFLRQIKKGGPVTVTHPDVKRYFMLIPEAVQLVLHAAAMGEPGSIYVLDMGTEFKVLDLARNLIRLCGHVPDVEIPISFIGLRPGEKLSEDLVGEDESAEPSSVDTILRINSRIPSRDRTLVAQRVSMLEKQALRGDIGAVLNGILELVPAYRTDHKSAAFPKRSVSEPLVAQPAVAQLVKSAHA